MNRKLGSEREREIFSIERNFFRFFSKVLKVVRLGEMDADQTVDSVREAELLSNLHNEHIVKVKSEQRESCFMSDEFSFTKASWKTIVCALWRNTAKVVISINDWKNWKSKIVAWKKVKSWNGWFKFSSPFNTCINLVFYIVIWKQETSSSSQIRSKSEISVSAGY